MTIDENSRRFEVHYQDVLTGLDMVIGTTHQPDGEPLMGITKYCNWACDPYIVDRHAAPIRCGCRACQNCGEPLEEPLQ